MIGVFHRGTIFYDEADFVSRTLTITELVRHFADYVNRVAYRGEQFRLTRGGKTVAELGPVATARSLTDLPDLIDGIPSLSEYRIRGILSLPRTGPNRTSGGRCAGPMDVLIDAGILIEAERGRLDVSDHVAGREDDDFFLSIITISELPPRRTSCEIAAATCMTECLRGGDHFAFPAPGRRPRDPMPCYGPTWRARVKLLTELREGDFFGEVALLNETRRSAAARTRTGTTLLCMLEPDLQTLDERSPRLGFKVLLALARIAGRRLIAISNEYEELRLSVERQGAPPADRADAAGERVIHEVRAGDGAGQTKPSDDRASARTFD